MERKIWRPYIKGWGLGNYALIFAQKGYDVHGIDISGRMLEIAQIKGKKADVKVNFIKADATRIPFPDNSFATVICLFAIEFTKHPEEVIQEIYRILCAGGHLILATLNRHSLWTVLRRIKGRFRSTVYNNAQPFLDLFVAYPLPVLCPGIYGDGSSASWAMVFRGLTL